MDDVGGVIQREVHHRRIILIDLNGQTMGFAGPAGLAAKAAEVRNRGNSRNVPDEYPRILNSFGTKYSF
jgi:hypothetical protein